MPVKQYTEYEKQTDGSWLEQHAKTDPEQIDGTIQQLDFTLASGFSKVSGYVNKLIYNAVGHFCWLSFTLSGLIQAQTWTKVLTVPSGYRPEASIVTPGAQGVRGAFQSRIDADGNVYVWAESTLTDVSGWTLYYVK